MKQKRFLALFSLMLSLASNVYAEDAWLPLEDEPSRKELLSLTGVELEPAYDLLSLRRRFLFPHDAIYADSNGTPRRNSVFGIDISHHNRPGLPFDLLRENNIAFVYAKATQGTRFMDPRFAGYWKAMAALPQERRVHRGAYHFLSASRDESAEAQADRFIAFVNLHGGFKDTDMPPVLDLEWDVPHLHAPDRWKNRTPQEIVRAALTWLKRVEKQTGRVPMIYTARSWWRERGIPESEFMKFAKYRVWIADISRHSLGSESPAVPNEAMAHLWQFSDEARLSEDYPGAFDANVFKGSFDQFKAVFAIADENQ